MMKNENNFFKNILTSFQRLRFQMVYSYISYCDHDLGKEIDVVVKVLFLLSIIIFNLMRILAVRQMTAVKTVIK